MDDYDDYLEDEYSGLSEMDDEDAFYSKYGHFPDDDDKEFYDEHGYFPSDEMHDAMAEAGELPNDYTDEEIVEAAFDDAMFDVASGSFHVSGRDVSHSPRVDVSKLTLEQYELYDTEYQSHYGLSDDGN